MNRTCGYCGMAESDRDLVEVGNHITNGIKTRAGGLHMHVRQHSAFFINEGACL